MNYCTRGSHAGGSLADLAIGVAMDICAKVPLDEHTVKQLQLANNGTLTQPMLDVCGEDLSKYISDLKGILPYTVLKTSLKLPGNICG